MANSIQINIISTNTFTINSYDKITNKKKTNKQINKQRKKERNKQTNSIMRQSNTRVPVDCAWESYF